MDASDWSWGALFLDVDLDGYEDLLVPNGFERDNMNVDALRQLEEVKRDKKRSPLDQLRLRTLFPRLQTANLAFRNLGNLRFQDQSEAWGFNFRGISQGMALADLDNDGDLDVVVNNLNQAAGVYRNEAVAPRVAVRLKGQPPNTAGIGARITLPGGPVVQSQEIMAGGHYLSCDEAMRVFAAGAGPMTLEVLWRSGRRSVLQDVRPNWLYEVDESTAGPVQAPAPPPVPAPFFGDVSRLLQHAHREEPFDDFALQPLLSRQLSQLGPGVCWWDADGDGRDDLFIGSGRGGVLGAYRNTVTGTFQPWQDAPWTQPVTRDQTTLLGWTDPAGQSVIVAGSANYEDGLSAGGSARLYHPTSKNVTDLLPGQDNSAGPMAMGDVDGDGALDLFVGSRATARHYPVTGGSWLFRHRDSRFVLDSTNTNQLAQIGMVSGALFTDVDGDGDSDLVLACDWGPLRVLRNDRGVLRDVTTESGLESYRGWWNGVAAGDFNEDGRMDIIASNWGLNTKYQRFRQHPLRLYYGDLDGDGRDECIEAWFDPVRKSWLPLQPYHVVGPAMPWLQAKLVSCQDYAKATLAQLYGPHLTNYLEATWLETTLFVNRGNRFEPHPLPLEAQMTPAFAVCVGDLDGDGHEDVFLSQNFFAADLETSRYDAGRGLWLKGDGQGQFQTVPGQESGFAIYGEQRGAALCDYDADGRVDFVVTQNAAETKLYHNLRARPGLRVRLKGPPGNPHGIGAILRLGTAGHWGPAREIHAGAGYWSQDSVVQVLATPQPADSLLVRWPGAKEQVVSVPPQAREITVDVAGGVQTVR